MYFQYEDEFGNFRQTKTFNRLEVESLDDLTSGYSEGYIESFNKLNSFEEDGFYKVEADIVVKIKTFSSYIDEKLNPTGIRIND